MAKHGMPRILAPNGAVHYAGPLGSKALCGVEHFAKPNTRLRVTCPTCVEVYLYVHTWRLERVS